MTTTDATGVLSLGWLVIAAPLFGAAVLLLGGRRTDKWGHLLGVGMPALSFLVGAWLVLFLLACVWWTPHPRRLPWLAGVGLVLWVLVVVVVSVASR